jgi:membrane-associated phospholipid phosphatase
MKLLLILYLHLFFCSSLAQCQNLDIDILRKINGKESDFADHSFALLSKSATPISLTSPIAHLIVGIVKKDKALQKKSLLLGVQIASAMTISTILKYSINRTRPYLQYSFINNKTADFTPSFPSGHTTSAFATATSLSLAWPRWYVIIPSYTWAVGVGYSRLYLGAHYPSDVLAGAFLGTASSYLTWKVNQWLQKSTERKAKQKLMISQ